MKEHEKSKGYITYDYDAVTRSHLLTEKRQRSYIVYHESGNFNLSKPPSRTVLDHIENVAGLTVKMKETLFEAGKKSLFGIKDTRSKIIKLDKKPYIEVRIQADSPTELYEKIFKFRSNMNVYQVSEKMCTWDKVGDLTLHPDSDEKVVSDFDPGEVAKRKQLELQTFRQN